MDLSKSIHEREILAVQGLTVLPAHEGWNAVYWTICQRDDGSQYPVIELQPIIGWVIDLKGDVEEVRPITLGSFDRVGILDGVGIADVTPRDGFLGFMPPHETLTEHRPAWDAMAEEAWKRESGNRHLTQERSER